MGWQADSFGHGAHLLFLAATWLEVKGRPTAPGELAWDGKAEAAWKDVLSGCAAAAPTRCVVRSVLESARVEARAAPAPRHCTAGRATDGIHARTNPTHQS